MGRGGLNMDNWVSHSYGEALQKRTFLYYTNILFSQTTHLALPCPFNNLPLPPSLPLPPPELHFGTPLSEREYIILNVQYC